MEAQTLDRRGPLSPLAYPARSSPLLRSLLRQSLLADLEEEFVAGAVPPARVEAPWSRWLKDVDQGRKDRQPGGLQRALSAKPNMAAAIRQPPVSGQASHQTAWPRFRRGGQ
jgi:hypothetical protein